MMLMSKGRHVRFGLICFSFVSRECTIVCFGKLANYLVGLIVGGEGVGGVVERVREQECVSVWCSWQLAGVGWH